MKCRCARCAKANWKWKPRCAHGGANSSRRNSNNKPTSTVGFSPQNGRALWHARQQTLSLRTSVGVIELHLWYGYDPGAEGWGCPMRPRWGLQPHQRTRPGLEDKVVCTATVTGT